MRRLISRLRNIGVLNFVMQARRPQGRLCAVAVTQRAQRRVYRRCSCIGVFGTKNRPKAISARSGKVDASFTKEINLIRILGYLAYRAGCRLAPLSASLLAA